MRETLRSLGLSDAGGKYQLLDVLVSTQAILLEASRGNVDGLVNKVCYTHTCCLCPISAVFTITTHLHHQVQHSDNVCLLLLRSCQA